jgi:hypothetical protein
VDRVEDRTEGVRKLENGGLGGVRGGDPLRDGGFEKLRMDRGLVERASGTCLGR